MRYGAKKLSSVCVTALVVVLLVTSLFSGVVHSKDGIKVAFIDTGIATKHVEAWQVAQGQNYVFPNFDTQDRDGHGTATAGMMLGSVKLGLLGTCPEATVVPLVTHDRYPSGVAKIGDVLTVCQAIYDAIDVFGCRVINISMGIPKEEDNLRLAVEYAEEMGVVVVSAVGNDHLAHPEGKYYPANYQTVIGVGAADLTAEALKIADFSSRNGVSLLAPGVDLKTVTHRNEATPTLRSGTSYAAAYVSGLAAKLLLQSPSLTPAQVRALLYASSQSLQDEDSDRVWPVLGVEIKNPETITRGSLVNLLYIYDGEEGKEAEGFEGGLPESLAAKGLSLSNQNIEKVSIGNSDALLVDDGEGSEADSFENVLPVGSMADRDVEEITKDSLVNLLPEDGGGRKNEAESFADVMPDGSKGECDIKEIRSGNSEILSMDDGKYNSELEVFTDVLPSSPYAKGINWAVTNGILNGTGNNKFEPEKPVTYEQLAVILHRYAQYKNCDISLNENNANYKDNINNEDYKKVSPYAITAMQWANNIGLFEKTDHDLWLENNADVRLENQLDSEAENQLDLEQKNALSPQDDLTQAEVANILLNYSKTYS